MKKVKAVSKKVIIKNKVKVKNKVKAKSTVVSKYDGLKKYLRIVNYISAAQLYLKDNFLLERELRVSDIKNRLLGHWGGATGVAFILANLNFYLKEHQKANPKLRDIIFLLGPGHAFPGLQANLFMEKTLSYYFNSRNREIQNIFDFNISYDREGLANLILHFGSPKGFPTHASPDTPGAILEGGELGYSISNASGAVLDNKDLIAITMIGDGEAETASLATSWHISKFIDSRSNGVVLPILNLNSYKISGPTIFARMTDQELKDFFIGHDYEPYIIDAMSDTKILANRHNYNQDRDEVYIETQKVLEMTFQKILKMKKTGETKGLPIIILKSDKGWTGPKHYNGVKIENNSASHQVPLENCKTDTKELALLEKWLRSYRIDELLLPVKTKSVSIIEKRFNIDNQKLFLKEIEDIIPEKMYRLGENIHSQQSGRGKLKPLKTPSLTKIFKKQILGTNKDWEKHSPMKVVGAYLNEIFKLNEATKNFRFFSPDETYSNKLDGIFEETTRAWLAEIKPWEKDLAKTGRVIEILSENTLIGLMMGYVLTGRHAFFDTYEVFAQVAVSMVDQYLKFLRGAQNISWRGDVSGFNIILTSPGWLQEHNGYSHQNPGFIDDMLARNTELVELYFPVDAVSAGYATERIVKSKNKVNILIAGKDDARPLFLSEKEAKRSIEEGMMIFETYSDRLKKSEEYDLIVSGIGDYMTMEALAGLDLINKLFKKYGLAKERKQIKLGYLNISRIVASDNFSKETLVFNQKLKELIGRSKVFVNFHGHPQAVANLFFQAGFSKDIVEIRGYIERGGITTLLGMHLLNQTSRYHVAKWLVEELFKLKKIDKLTKDFLKKDIQKEMEVEADYINAHFVDSDEIQNFKFGE